MNKPVKPSKTRLISNSTEYHFDWVSNKVALDAFVYWIKESVPKNATDVCIGLEEDWGYDDHITGIQLSWKEPVPNTRYKSEMNRYQKQLTKWKEACKKK